MREKKEKSNFKIGCLGVIVICIIILVISSLFTHSKFNKTTNQEEYINYAITTLNNSMTNLANIEGQTFSIPKEGFTFFNEKEYIKNCEDYRAAWANYNLLYKDPSISPYYNKIKDIEQQENKAYELLVHGTGEAVSNRNETDTAQGVKLANELGNNIVPQMINELKAELKKLNN